MYPQSDFSDFFLHLLSPLGKASVNREGVIKESKQIQRTFEHLGVVLKQTWKLSTQTCFAMFFCEM